MPNWCMNTLQITGPRERIEDLAKAFAESKLFHHVRPIPEPLNDPDTGSYGGENAEEKNALRARLKAEFGYEGWYDWCNANWGTKWDVSGLDSNYEVKDVGDGQSLMTARFDSAWTPPIPIYEVLVDEGLQVKAYYCEPGCGFCGRFEDGNDDYFEMNSREEAAQLPHDIVEEFDMLNMYDEEVE
jgi:Ferredoxin-like domain in Api92-like protein